MKTIGVNLEESEIEELLKAEKTDNKSDALRLVIKEWKDQKWTITDLNRTIGHLNRNILSLERDLKDARYHRSLRGVLIVIASIAAFSLLEVAFVVLKYVFKP